MRYYVQKKDCNFISKGNLYVVRHGETDFNIQRRYTGTMDIPLNSNGIRQAKVLAEKLVHYPIDIIISSDLSRAIQTSEHINEKLKKKIIIMPEFRERCAGIYEGLTKGKKQKRLIQTLV